MFNHAQRLVEVSVEYGLGVFATTGQFFVGLSLFHKGQQDIGIARMERALADCEAASFKLAVANFIAILAEAKCTTGRVTEAAALCAKARCLMESCKEGWFTSEILSIEAVIKMSSGSKNEEEAASLIKSALQYANDVASPTLAKRCLRRAKALCLQDIVA